MLDDQEESVRIAVKALGDMRNSGPRPRTPPSSTLSPSPSLDTATASPPAFVSRMSTFPLVGSALRVYEQGKASSRVVKYGAEMVESSVKSISRPVIDRLPVNVNQIDEFACRQLDRLDRYRRPSASEHPPSPTSASSMAISTSPSASDRDRGRPKLKTKTLDGTAVDDEDGPDISTSSSPTSPGRLKRVSSKPSWKGGECGVPSWLEANSPFVPPPPPPPPDSRASTPTQVGDDEGGKEELSSERGAVAEGPESQVAQRSRWQAVLLEAGGLSAALSEESMRRLKYCLHWLQYATAHIDAQILILRDFTANLQPLPSSDVSTSRRPPISEEHMRKLTDVRRDIVHTIRQVVDVVSKYAGGALPEPARGRVRGFILKLPQRWASKASGAGGAGAGALGLGERERETVAAAGTGTGALRRPGGQRRAAQRERGTGADGGGVRSGPSSRATSPAASPRVARAVVGNGGASSGAEGSGSNGGGNVMSASAALVASQRILALATESLDMMRNVTRVVKESLDRADAWVGRLRTVGIQRGAQEIEDTTDPSNTSTNDTNPRPPAYEPNFTADTRNSSSYDFDFSSTTASSSASSPLPSPSLYMMRHRHQRSESMQSMQSVDEGYASVAGGSNANANAPPSSPFFSSGSVSGASSNWGSSIPSTPGVYTPGYGGYAGYNTNNPSNHIPTIGIGKMSLGSRYNTPRRGVVGLPGDEEVGEGTEGMVVESERRGVDRGEGDRGKKVLMVDTTNGKEPRL